VWDIVERKDGECPSITFQYDSKDGEEGNALTIISVLKFSCSSLPIET
jgi:hypothetical protein